MINLEKATFIKFAGGEVHLNGQDFFNLPVGILKDVWSPIRTSDDLMKLLLFTNAYKAEYSESFDVYIPYIPYARQDRISNPGESLSIAVFADIINSQNYKHVYVMDPHSDVCTGLIKNIREIYKVNDEYLRKIIPDYDEYVVLAPDAGAYKKLSKSIKDVPLIYCTKHRDTRTGVLNNLEVHLGPVDIKNKKILVVDDICDGGGTFLLLADEFGKRYKNELNLYVSHGIFSNGYTELKKRYKHIYTTNSFYQDNQDFITCFNLIAEKEKLDSMEENYVRRAV